MEKVDQKLFDTLDSVQQCERAIRASAQRCMVLRLTATHRGIDRLDGLRTLVSYEPDGTTIYVGTYEGSPWTIVVTRVSHGFVVRGRSGGDGKEVWYHGDGSWRGRDGATVFLAPWSEGELQAFREVNARSVFDVKIESVA